MTDRVLRAASSLKYKDGDEPFIEFPSSNTHELLVFTDRVRVQGCRIRRHQIGPAQIYLPTELEMDPMKP